MKNQRNQNPLDNIHPDLYLAQQLAYEPSGLKATNIKKEEEGADYGAFDFNLGGRNCKFRVGKITPKKVGFFFTIWKRIGTGPIMPYDLSDPIDLFIFSVCSKDHFGQFIFPKTVLYEKGVISKEEKGGKRAIRVYPPWALTVSPQAKNTQSWQEDYFFEIPKDKSVDSFRLHDLLSQRKQ